MIRMFKGQQESTIRTQKRILRSHRETQRWCNGGDVAWSVQKERKEVNIRSAISS